MNKVITRGIRNNNPFNIRRSGTRWQGKLYSGKDNLFEVFTSMDYGIRAGIIILRTYVSVHKLTSVKTIISRFAPESENDTSAYVSYCEKYLHDRGFDSDHIVFGDMAFCSLCSAIMIFESKFYILPVMVHDYLLKFNLI